MSERIKEGIVSNKDGEKTFDQVYANGIDLDEQDEMFAKQFSHCFESANGKPANRLRESSDDANEDALAHARRLRSMLSKGEKLHYGLNYVARRTDK